MNRPMKPPPEEMARRLIYILYRAWVEARAYSGDSQRIFDLSDAMHNAPALLTNFDEEGLDFFRDDLRRYCEKHSSATNYLACLDQGVPDDSQWLWLKADEKPPD
jgi:hypothetical protein